MRVGTTIVMTLVSVHFTCKAAYGWIFFLDIILVRSNK